jgi:hypothetical protein
VGFCVIEWALTPEGHTSGLYIAGSVVYGSVIIIANMTIFASLNMYGIVCEVLLFLSILVYFLVLFILNNVATIPQLYGIFEPMMLHPITYLSFFFMFFVPFTIDRMIGAVKDALEAIQNRREQEQIEREREFVKDMHMPKRSSTLKRTGYAFAQEDHAAPQIMDTLSKAMHAKIHDEISQKLLGKV